MQYRTCGECKHFIKDEVGAFGTCELREFLIDRHGGYQNRKFSPARSRMACKNDFEEKTEAEDKKCP